MNQLTFDKARELSITNFLLNNNFKPTKVSGDDFWYISPFRSENTASFKVSNRLNRWYDHSEGCGGNIIDLVIKLYQCSPLKALERLSGNSHFSFHQPTKPKQYERGNANYKIIDIRPLNNKALLNYLESRKIDLTIAKQYCMEVHYQINQKIFFALAFENDSKGIEIRNKYFKGSLKKKNITSISNKSKSVAIFEGFIDFLSYKTLQKNRQKEEDYIILNSIALIDKLQTSLTNYTHINSYLDNDDAGKRGTIYLKKINPNVKDNSSMFSEFKDLNDKLMNT